MRLLALSLIAAAGIIACARAHEVVPPPAPHVASTPAPDAGSQPSKSDEDVALERILEFDAGSYNADDARRALAVSQEKCPCEPRPVARPLADCLPKGRLQPSTRTCHDADEFPHDTHRPPDGSRLRLRGKLAAYAQPRSERLPSVFLGRDFNVVTWSTDGVAGCEGNAMVEVEGTVDYSREGIFGFDEDRGTIPLTNVRIVTVFDTAEARCTSSANTVRK